MTLMTQPRSEPCADMARRMRTQAAPLEMSHDALEFLIEGYAKLVESLLDPRASASGIEFAYSRLLGTRGNICRLCSVGRHGTTAQKGLEALGLGGNLSP